MYVIKRSGDKVPVRYDSITDRNSELSKGLNIDVAYLSKMIIESLKNGMTTNEIDELSSETAAYMSSYEPDYDILAARIAVSNHSKNTSRDFISTMRKIHDHINSGNGRKLNIISDRMIEFIEKHSERIQQEINYENDYNYSYFGFKTLLRLYLLKIDGKVVERPQHMLMRVACSLHGPNPNQSEGDIERAIQCYHDMSSGFYTHASPTLFNAGSEREQLSSCFLLHTEDDLKHIYETNSRCALISKHGGGIGIDISKVRAKGSIINSTNGTSDGIIPMIKVFNATSLYCNQCFTEDTIIYTKEGQKKIKDVNRLDEVITNDGTFRPVVDIFTNDIDKEILEFWSDFTFEWVKLTKEHQVYAIKSETADIKIVSSKLREKTVSPSYISAEELSPNDFVGFPIQKLSETDIYTDLGNDFFRFYGIMLSCSSISEDRKYTTLTLGTSTSVDTLLFVRRYLKKSGAVFCEDEKSCSVIIKWNDNHPIKDSCIGITYDDLYNANTDLRVHSKYINISREHRIHLLKGLFGSVTYTNEGVDLAVKSYELAHNVRYFLLSLGIFSSGYQSNREVRKNKSIQLEYSLRVFNQYQLKDIVPIRENGYVRSYFIYDNIMWCRIHEIRKTNYKGNVYDLSILDNNNYLVGSLGLVHNSGKRKGSFAMYLQPWHPDIVEFIALRYNNPPEELRARDIFLALWINDLFMERVEKDEIWSMFCPSTVPQLNDTFGEEFNQIYIQAEKEKKYMKQMRARDLWEKILHAQTETGLPYILYKDSINRKSMQSNLGIIRSSNLCVSGDTKLTTNTGDVAIKDLVDTEVEVWNGFEWSTVTPRLTNVNQQLMKITLGYDTYSRSPSSGFCNSLDDVIIQCTSNHKFPVIERDGDTKFRLVEATDLKIGDLILRHDDPFGNFPDDGTVFYGSPRDHLTGKLITNESYKVVRIQQLDGYHDTYCVKEPRRGLCLFNGVLLGNCAEIVEVTDRNSVAVCNLSSLALPKYVRYVDNKPIFDYEKLYQITKTIVRNIDNIIDINFYPVEEARTNNINYRPMGIGIQGLADVFAIFKAPWGSDTASHLNRTIFETIYYAAVEASHELSIERGSYSGFEGSPYEKGILQYHLWNISPTTRYDWKSLEDRVKKGMRNSLLIALMPTASSSQILNNNECFEPFTSNLYSRNTLAGDFIMLNKHLVKDLKAIGLWNRDLVNRIIENDGSIQSIEVIPKELRDVYKTVWEISQKIVVDYAAERAPFIDQTQSMNIFMDHPTNAKLSSMHMYGWKKGLKTGSYYIRTKAARNAVKFSILREAASTQVGLKENRRDDDLRSTVQGEKAGKEYMRNGKKILCTEDVCTSCSA